MDMRNAAICSGMMHGALLVVLVFGLPSYVTPLNETIVPIDASPVCRMGGAVRCLTWHATGDHATTVIEYADR